MKQIYAGCLAYEDLTVRHNGQGENFTTTFLWGGKEVKTAITPIGGSANCVVDNFGITVEIGEDAQAAIVRILQAV